MQTRSSDKNSVCPSVYLFVKRVDCDKTEENLSRFLAKRERVMIAISINQLIQSINVMTNTGSAEPLCRYLY